MARRFFNATGFIPAIILMLVAGSSCGRHVGPNLVLIVIDTMRADRLSCYGYKENRTPNIDALANRGVLMDRAVSHVPITLPSFSTIMTSRLPPTNGVHYNGGFYLDDSALTLAEILGERGYSSAAVVASIVLSSVNGISQGFAEYDDNFPEFHGYRREIRMTQSRLNHTQRRAEEVTDRVLSLADTLAAESPFFLFAHYFDPHSPLDPPPPYSLINPLLNAGSEEMDSEYYDGEVAYTDKHIGRLLDGLEARGMLENTLVVLAGDHGEGLGDHGEKSHGYYVYDTTLHVPLIYSMPGRIPEGETFKGLARLIDVAPTILDIMGIAWDKYGFQGVSDYPFDKGAHRDTFSYLECAAPYIGYGWCALRGVQNGSWKYISAPREELYDLASDPGEETNVLDQRPDVADSLRDELEQLVSGIDIYHGNGSGQEMSTASDSSLDMDFQEKLRALGYVGGTNAFTSTYEEMFDHSLPDPKDKIKDFDNILLSTLDLRLGLGFSAMDSVDKAIDYLTKAVRLNPENADAFFYLGLTYLKMKDFDRAEGLLENALEVDPGESKAGLALANLKLLSGDSTSAEAELEGALSRGVTAETEMVLVARLWNRLGRADRAVEAMQAVIETYPNDVPARILRGENDCGRGEYENAV